MRFSGSGAVSVKAVTVRAGVERVRVVAGRFERGSVERWWSDPIFDR